MGYGFVVLFFLICIFIISCIVAVIAAIITFLASTKEKRKRKVALAVFSPFIGFYTMFFVALIGSMIVSDIKGVDLGIGDSWHVPLKGDWKLLMIDSNESAYIERGDHTVLTDVSHIYQIGDTAYGKISGSFQKEKYFSLNLQNQKTVEYDSLQSLVAAEHPKSLKLVDVSTFYDQRREELLGASNYIIGLLSVVMGMVAVFIFCRLVLFGIPLGFGRRT